MPRKENCMVKISKRNMDRIAPFFSGCGDTLILSCLQGHMGGAWADNEESPSCAQIITGDFCFFGGSTESGEAAALVKNIPEGFSAEYLLMIPHTEEWRSLIEREYGSELNKFLRYGIKKEEYSFDKALLQSYINRLSDEYSVVKIDSGLYFKTCENKFSRDFCSQFPTYDDYAAHGLGYVALKDGKIVGGASSYTYYNDGIEIEIATDEPYRRQGIALACASSLILECVKCGLYPSWDAANMASVALSEKLGYKFDREYITYSVRVN